MAVHFGARCAWRSRPTFAPGFFAPPAKPELVAPKARRAAKKPGANVGRLLRSRGSEDDGKESLQLQRSPADQRAVELGLGEQRLGVLGLDAAAVENAQAVRGVAPGGAGASAQ